MLAMELKPGMTIKEGRFTRRVSEVVFPCSPHTKVHVKVIKSTPEGKKTEFWCYDRTAEVDASLLS